MRKKFFIVILLKFQIVQILLVTSYYFYVKKLDGLEMDAETYVRFESFQKGQSP